MFSGTVGVGLTSPSCHKRKCVLPCIYPKLVAYSRRELAIPARGIVFARANADEGVQGATDPTGMVPAAKHLTGGRSVYSEAELAEWKATYTRPVKVINYLVATYIEPPVVLAELIQLRVMTASPPQSIFEIHRPQLEALLQRLNLGFRT
jgi:hypothetical protein